MASISMKNMKKIYPGNVVAVQEFNLEIEDKEFIILVGPSGCGKSTTLRMIAGLEDISEGELYIGDKKVNDVAPKDRDIAMVFQNYALYPHMTVFKNMAFGLTLRKMPKAEIKRKVEDAAKVLGIEHLLERKPKALSGGQRQRVATLGKGRAVVLLAELGRAREQLGLVAELLAHVRVQANLVEEVVALKDAVVLHHPQVFGADKGLEDGGRDVRVVVAAQRVPNVVQQRTHHIFLVAPVAVRQRGGLQAVRQPVDWKAAAIAIEQAQVVEHAIGQLLRKGPRFGRNDGPVFYRAVGHVREVRVLRHGCLLARGCRCARHVVPQAQAAVWWRWAPLACHAGEPAQAPRRRALSPTSAQTGDCAQAALCADKHGNAHLHELPCRLIRFLHRLDLQ